MFKLKSRLAYLSLSVLTIFLSVTSAFLCSTTLAHADGLESLQQFYNDTKSVKADFTQVVTDKKGRKVQEVAGNMQLKRPNKFRWDYNKPYEQEIISDGKQVWLYDTELAQVTVRAVSKVLGASPAALLAGDDALEKNFQLNNIDLKDDLHWITAVPRVQDSGFEKILLGFADSKLGKMELTDSFGHKTVITFTNVIQNPTIADKVFVFKTPQGVDVVSE